MAALLLAFRNEILVLWEEYVKSPICKNECPISAPKWSDDKQKRSSWLFAPVGHINISTRKTMGREDSMRTESGGPHTCLVVELLYFFKSLRSDFC